MYGGTMLTGVVSAQFAGHDWGAWAVTGLTIATVVVALIAVSACSKLRRRGRIRRASGGSSSWR